MEIFGYFFSSAIIKNVLAVCLIVGGGLSGYYGVKKISKVYKQYQYEKKIKENFNERQKLNRIDSLKLITD